MIKSILVRIALLIGLCFGSFLFVNKLCFAQVYPMMDGAVHSIKIQQRWEIKMDQQQDGTYKAHPFMCKFTTDYIGKSGVRIVTEATNGWGGESFYVKAGTPIKINFNHDDSFTEVFKEPGFIVTNDGCSIYQDGDTCKHNLNEKPIVYGSCIYTN